MALNLHFALTATDRAVTVREPSVVVVLGAQVAVRILGMRLGRRLELARHWRDE
jgi:hypothetical protein